MSLIMKLIISIILLSKDGVMRRLMPCLYHDIGQFNNPQIRTHPLLFSTSEEPTPALTPAL